MRRMKAIAGGIALVLVLIAAGCGSSSSGNSSGASASSVGLARLNYTPPATHNLNLVTWDLALGEPQSLDPILAYDYSPSEVVVNLCDSLLYQTPNGAIVNDLATNVTHPTPLTWVYTIRSGVHFWNGAPMTIGDVLFSIERNMIPKDGSSYLSPWGQFIRSIKQSGPDQVTVTTTYPNVAVNQMMASGLGMVTQKSYVLAKGKAYGTPQGGIMCTGPFEFVRWTPGSDILIKRNPNYWNKALEPKVNEVDFKFLSDPATLTDALLSGSIDGTVRGPASRNPATTGEQHGQVVARQRSADDLYVDRPFRRTPGKSEGA